MKKENADEIVNCKVVYDVVYQVNEETFSKRIDKFVFSKRYVILGVLICLLLFSFLFVVFGYLAFLFLKVW